MRTRSAARASSELAWSARLSEVEKAPEVGAAQVNVHQTLEHLVHEALQKSGNQGQAPSESAADAKD